MNRRWTLSTSIGRIEITPTESDHVYVSQPSNEPVTINGVAYNISVHLYRNDAGVFEPKTYADMHLSFAPWRRTDPSWAARRKLRAVILETVNEWITNSPAAMIAAEENHIDACVRSAEEEIATHEGAIALLRAKITSLREKGK
jgi:hypothetical protein